MFREDSDLVRSTTIWRNPYHSPGGSMRIAFITAGAAGMYCGSCLRDNALVTALHGRGHDALLIPTYTPLTLDEPEAEHSKVFLGGVNVYLQEKSWLFRHTPRILDKLLDAPRLLRWAGRFATRTNYSKLGGLLISMLEGTHGHQVKEIRRLADWLKDEVKPEVVLLTNVLLSGIVPALTEALGVPVVATLQGDDIFLDQLPKRDRERCLALIRSNCDLMYGLIATSSYYAEYMAGYLGIDRNRIEVIPSGINLAGHGGPKPSRTDDRPVIRVLRPHRTGEGSAQSGSRIYSIAENAGCPEVAASGFGLAREPTQTLSRGTNPKIGSGRVRR